MSVVVTQEGATILWQYILKIVTPVNPTVHLIGSPFSPLHTTVLANLSAVEIPVAAGYAPILLSTPGSHWSFANVAAGVTATHDLLTWTFTTGYTVYGYWLSDDTNGKSWWPDMFTPAFVFPSAGGIFTLQLPPYLISCPGVDAC